MLWFYDLHLRHLLGSSQPPSLQHGNWQLHFFRLGLYFLMHWQTSMFKIVTSTLSKPWNEIKFLKHWFLGLGVFIRHPKHCNLSLLSSKQLPNSIWLDWWFLGFFIRTYCPIDWCFWNLYVDFILVYLHQATGFIVVLDPSKPCWSLQNLCKLLTGPWKSFIKAPCRSFVGLYNPINSCQIRGRPYMTSYDCYLFLTHQMFC